MPYLDGDTDRDILSRARVLQAEDFIESLITNFPIIRQPWIYFTRYSSTNAKLVQTYLPVHDLLHQVPYSAGRAPLAAPAFCITPWDKWNGALPRKQALKVLVVQPSTTIILIWMVNRLVESKSKPNWTRCVSLGDQGLILAFLFASSFEFPHPVALFQFQALSNHVGNFCVFFRVPKF